MPISDAIPSFGRGNLILEEPYSNLLPELRQRVRDILAAMPHCHGWDHTLRVWHNARYIAQVEKADQAVVEYAALLHDIGRAKEFEDLGKSCHAEIGAAEIPEILAQIGITDDAFVQHVRECVYTHRYRKRETRRPETLEAKVVFDADKLDSIGAVGLGRAFHFAGRVGARVHNAREEALTSESYSAEDTAYREYLVKLQHIHENMLTEEGKRMAEQRHHFMQQFFERLNREVLGKDYGVG